MNYSTQKFFAIKIAKESGKILLKYFKQVDKLKTSKKSKHEIVTPADLAVNENFIKKALQNFPAYGILSEETERLGGEAEYYWIIDPLDGTTNFSLGNPFFNTSIALVHKNEVVLGVTYAPFLKQLFVAEKDRGAILNGKKIKVSKECNLSDTIVNYGYSYHDQVNKKFMKVYEHMMMDLQNSRNMGAAALELAWVAMGRLEVYVLFGLKIWDVAAGTLLVSEAGGQITDFANQDFNLEATTLLASNKILHKKLLNIIAPLPKK